MRILQWTLGLALMVCLTGTVQADLVNGDFEGGDLTGWDTAGNPSVVANPYFGVNNPFGGGQNQALLDLLDDTEVVGIDDVGTLLGLSNARLQDLVSGAGYGQAMAQTFTTGNQGGTLRFEWNFLEADAIGIDFSDGAIWSLSGVNNGSLLADDATNPISDGSNPFANETLYDEIEVELAANTTYTLGFAVLLAETDGDSVAPGDAGLLVDNVSFTAVPEPSTTAALALGAVGLAGIGLVRRRRRKLAAAE